MSSSGPVAQIPLTVRLRLARASVQWVADRWGCDILHLKGDTVDRTLRPFPAAGSDVDILVRPSDVTVLDLALRDLGWEVYSTFEYGSPFGHAQTYRHDTWGYLDLHRRFPGIGIAPSRAFDHLWAGRATVELGGAVCSVPGVSAQAVILVLNAARSLSSNRRDVDAVWTNADDAARRGIAAERDALDAGLAFDAATGRLERHRGERGYPLWHAVTSGSGRSQEWWGRVLAADTTRERLGVLARVPRVNVDHLAHELGRSPTRGEVVEEFFARPVRAMRELLGRPGRGGGA